MDIKVNGKGLHQLTREELIQADKEIKLAFLQTSQKNGLQQFRVGDNVKVAKRSWSAEGVIEDIGSKTATVNIGDQTILATAKMISRLYPCFIFTSTYYSLFGELLPSPDSIILSGTVRITPDSPVCNC